jgi:hypothetical protein
VATPTRSPSVKKAPTAIPSVKVTTKPVAKVSSQPTVKPVVKTTSSPVAKAICNDNPVATYTLVSGATKLCSQLASKSLKRRTNVCSGLVSNAASICPVCLCGFISENKNSRLESHSLFFFRILVLDFALISPVVTIKKLSSLPMLVSIMFSNVLFPVRN